MPGQGEPPARFRGPAKSLPKKMGAQKISDKNKAGSDKTEPALL